MLLLPIGLMAPAAMAAGSLLLDGIGIAVACSVRALRSDYAGPAVRVRRSSDNAEQDIGFTSGLLDTAALLSFCGSGDGFVPKWYSSDPAGHHPTQTVAANQPRIVAAGALDVSAGHVCLNNTVANQWLVIPPAAFAGLSSSTAICAFANGNNSGWWWIGSAGTHTHTPYGDGYAYEQYLGTSRPSFGPYAQSTVPVVHTAHNDGALLSVFRNGSQVGGSQAAGFTATPSKTGDAGDGFGAVVLSEVVLTSAALSTASRQAIERSMGAFYGITVA